METVLNRAGRAAESVRLTVTEKSAMRTALIGRLDLAASVSPLGRLRSSMAASWSGLRTALRAVSRPAMAFTALVGLVAVGSGTVMAAENSLPGEPLYSLKVSVTEPVRQALAVTPEAKARWSVEVVERRLAEAERLDASGRLDGQKKKEVESRLKKDAETATRNVADLGRTENLPATAAVIGSDLEASLRGHGQRLGRSKTGGKKDKEHAASVAAVAAQAADEAASVREEEEKSMADGPSVSVEAVRARIDAVERRIDRVRARLDVKRGSEGIEEVAEAVAKLKDAEDSLAAGREKMRSGDMVAAFSLVQQADRTAQEAQLIVLPRKTRETKSAEPKKDDDDTPKGSPRAGRDLRSERRGDGD